MIIDSDDPLLNSRCDKYPSRQKILIKGLCKINDAHDMVNQELAPGKDNDE